MCCWITVHLRGGGPFVVSTGTLRVLELRMSNAGTTTVASGATLRITDAGGFYGLLVSRLAVGGEQRHGVAGAVH